MNMITSEEFIDSAASVKKQVKSEIDVEAKEKEIRTIMH